MIQLDDGALNPCVQAAGTWDSPPGTVVVLGTARGGTSMVAGVLRILGVDLGAELDEDNNEDRVFLQHGGDRRIFSERSLASRKREYLKHVRRYIAERNQAGRTWGWKDPLASHYIEDVVGHLARPAFLFVARDPIAIATRQLFEEKSTAPGALLAYMLHALEDYRWVATFLTGCSPPPLLISYERALRHPEATVAGIRDYLVWPKDEEAERRAADFIVPDRGPARL